MKEIWKDIKGYEGFYQISNLGNVRSLQRKAPSGKSVKQIIRKQSIDKNGYCVVGLNKNKTQKTYKVHRLVAIAFIDNPKNLPEVNHKDEDKTNNNVSNLEWCDAKYNLTYGSRKDMFVGTKNNNCKLSEQDVKDIRRLYKKRDPKFNSLALGKKYGISHTHILNIIKNKSWNNIKEVE